MADWSKGTLSPSLLLSESFDRRFIQSTQFAAMIRQDRNRLVQRTYARHQAEAAAGHPGNSGSGNGTFEGVNSNGGGSTGTIPSPYDMASQQLFPSPVGGQNNLPLHSGGYH